MRKYGPTHGRTGKPSPVDAHIGARVRARRRLLAMRQESLGKALGVSFQMVQQYERGAVRISAAQLYDMANALDVPVGFFFDDMPAAIAAAKTAQGDGRAEPERPCAWLRPLNRPRSWEEVQRIINETGPGRLCPLHMSDGPILLDALRERIVGRVIGLYQHPGHGNS